MVERLREELAAVADTRRGVTACLAATKCSSKDGGAVAEALASHLGKLTATQLPETARAVWREQVSRPLKADPEKPLTSRHFEAIRSWPGARVGGLVAALAELETQLGEAEIEAANAIVHAEIAWEYS